MTLPSQFTDPILRITLTLAEYPILCDQIRESMRQQLFSAGMISQQDFEKTARKQAIQSQIREGLDDPYGDESADQWERRLQRVRDHLTDFYFATSRPYELFETILVETLKREGGDEEDVWISFNAELAPKTLLFDQARVIERLPPEQRAVYEHRLEEIKVVLIKALISDQLQYIRIAKKWFTVEDLFMILKRKIGYGRIGGKAAGMLLATSIIRRVANDSITDCIEYPESFFLGSDLMYTFMTANGLMHWNDQKYKTEDEIRTDYPTIFEQYRAGNFPADVQDRLSDRLAEMGTKPLIVRSSSQLEDNFSTAFAGKYESYFCPNQGTHEENLNNLIIAIASVYASTLNPDALLYRRAKGLQDYDERMAILIQAVQGEKFGKYFLPHAAGVAFSRNSYRWTPEIRKEDGFIRLVWGLGTRAVDRVGNDYPRLVALSHPGLRPEGSPDSIRRYSQQYVDLIDLEENCLKTLPVKDVLTPQYKPIRYLAQLHRDGYLASIRSIIIGDSAGELVLTFEELLKRTKFAQIMRDVLSILEVRYGGAVDLEFTAKIQDPTSSKPEVSISILQCRPLSHLEDEGARLPANLAQEQIVFSTSRVVPHGHVRNIQYVVFVSPEEYYKLETQIERIAVGQMIGKLNKILEGKCFICVGPGRWGTTNPDLGVRAGYGDIYNARALIELTGKSIGPDPEPSYGTHFFQDLLESKIFPLAIYFEDEDVIFNRDFFYHSPNHLDQLLKSPIVGEHTSAEKCVRVIKVREYRKKQRLELIMDDDQGKAVAFFVSDKRKN